MDTSPKHDGLIIAAITAGVLAVTALFFAAPAFTPRAHAAAIGSHVTFTGGSKASTDPNAMTSDGTYVWVVNQNGTVTKWGRYAALATYPTTATQITVGFSITFDGTNLWVAGQNGSNQILTELSTDGTEIRSVNLGGHLAWSLISDGTNIWEGSSAFLQEISPTGTIIFSTSTPQGQIYSMGFDGTNIWVAGSSNVLQRYSTSGALVGSTTFASSTSVISYGMHFDGINMWVAYQNSSNEDVAELSSSGTLINTYINSGTTSRTPMVFDGTNMWIGNSNGTVSQIAPTGTITNYSASAVWTLTYVSSTKTLWSANGSSFTESMNIIQTAVLPGDSTLSALSGSFITLSPSFTSASTSYYAYFLANATSGTLVATTTDPLAEMLINATTTANGVPVTMAFSNSNAYGAESSFQSFQITVYAQDYTSNTYTLRVAATSTADSALTFTSNNDSVACPSTSPMHCTLNATSSQVPVPFDIIPTLAVPGGSITVNGTPVTSGSDYTGSSTVGSFSSLTINVTGADNSTSTYSVSISVAYPHVTGEEDYGSFSNWNFANLTTLNGNAWGADNGGNLYEVTPSGTVTEFTYGGTDSGFSPFGLTNDGTNLWMVGNSYPTSGIIRYTPGTNTWNTFDPPATVTNDGDGYYGVAADKFGNIWAVNWDDDSLIELSPTGTYIGNFPNAITPTNLQETYDAITYDGTNMWAYTGERSAEQLNEFSPTGTVLTALHIPGCYPAGITFDGTNIWTLDQCGTVTEVAPDGTTILKTITTGLSGSGDGITFDGSNIWVTGSSYVEEIVPSTGAGYAYQYNLSNASAMTYSNSTDMLWAYASGVATFPPIQPGGASAASTYSITVTQGSNGTISPGTQTGISSGGSETFTISPDSGYAVASLTVDGSAVAAATSYTFSNITANHTITATFSAVASPVISVAAGGGGGGGGYIPPTTPTNTPSSTTSTSTLPIVSTSTPSTSPAVTTSAVSSTPALTLPPIPPVPPLPSTTKKNSKTNAYVFVVDEVLNGYGGTETPSNFTVSVKGKSASPSSFKGSASGTLVAMQPGAYSVSQKAVAGYSTVLSPDCSGTAVANQAATCIIVESQLPPPHLTVITDVINSYFGAATSSDFSIKVSGSQVSPSSFVGSAAGTSVSLAAGRYSVSAKAPKGYTLTYSGCSGRVTYGDDPVCTVIASDPPVAELLVREAVLNNYGGTKTAGNFSITVHGKSASPSSFTGNASDTTVILKPGDYSVAQKAVTGYATTLSPGCSGSIVAGEIIQCTVVASDLQPPYLTVYVGTVNGYGGTVLPSDLSIKVSGTKVSPSSFAGSAAGTLISLGTGKYSVSAKYLPGYSVKYSGCSGSVTWGSNPVCAVTATQTKPKGWVPPPTIPTSTLPVTPTSTAPTSTVPTTPTSTPITPTSTTPVTPTSTTPTSTPSTPTSTPPVISTSTPTSTTPTTPTSTPTSTTVVIITIPTSTPPLTPTSTNITVNNGVPVVTTTTVTVTLPPNFTSGGSVNTSNNGGDSSGWIAVPDGPYSWTLDSGDGVKTVTVFYEAPNSSSTVASTFRVFLDTGNDVLQEPQLDCSGLYLTGYAFANHPSDPTTVIKIQQFLNKYMGDDLIVNGIYDEETQTAVGQFQLQYSKQILAPWVPYGLPNSTTPTSNTYKTTQRWINVLACPGISLPVPMLP